jgi:DNA-directed RNA polymerase subunit E'/Rpb7
MLSPAQLQTKINLPVNLLSSQGVIIDKLRELIEKKIGGKCVAAGYVERNSIVVISHSCGCLSLGIIEFDVVFSCNVFYPLPGTLIRCKVEGVTRAGGIHCKYYVSPTDYALEIFVVRSETENESDDQFEYSFLKVGDTIQVQLEDIRFELGDATITAIAKYKDSLPEHDSDSDDGDIQRDINAFVQR